MLSHPLFIPREQIHKPFGSVSNLSSHSYEILRTYICRALIILAVNPVPGVGAGESHTGELSHKAASFARCFSPKGRRCPFLHKQSPRGRGICPSGYHEGLFWAESWHERALPVSNIRIKDIIILINFPMPMLCAFIICIEIKP